MKTKQTNIFILSDGTGETSTAVVRATLVQYESENVSTSLHPNIRTSQQLQSILKIAKEQKAIVAYTIVVPSIRKEIKDACIKQNIAYIDLLGPVIQIFDQRLIKKPQTKPGILHQVNEDYFKRIEDIEFSLRHDDGSITQNLKMADIILIGVSRTSKTPLSVFLSYKGYKVANIPFIKDIQLPEEVFKVNTKKIIALTIDEETLLKIRKNRLQKIGVHTRGEYADKAYVYDELAQARACFTKHRWPVINVTDRALEETAGEILRIIRLRHS